MLPVYFILVFWYFIFYTDTHMNTLCEYISGESYFTFGARRVAPFFLLVLIYTQMGYTFLRMLQ